MESRITIRITILVPTFEVSKREGRGARRNVPRNLEKSYIGYRKSLQYLALFPHQDFLERIKRPAKAEAPPTKKSTGKVVLCEEGMKQVRAPTLGSIPLSLLPPK